LLPERQKFVAYTARTVRKAGTSVEHHSNYPRCCEEKRKKHELGTRIYPGFRIHYNDHVAKLFSIAVKQGVPSTEMATSGNATPGPLKKCDEITDCVTWRYLKSVQNC
jgi:hypothetical protein